MFLPLKKPLKALLLDRDGVLNQEPGPILQAEKFYWIDGSLDALVKSTQAGWLNLVITNQAAVARGLLPQHELTRITNKMVQQAQNRAATIHGQYVCPHSPTHQTGWIAKLCGPCACRKPADGLFKQASAEFNFNWDECVFIGDSTSDWEAAKRLGILSVGVKTGHAGRDGRFSTQPSVWANNLNQAVDALISTHQKLSLEL